MLLNMVFAIFNMVDVTLKITFKTIKDFIIKYVFFLKKRDLIGGDSIREN